MSDTLEKIRKKLQDIAGSYVEPAKKLVSFEKYKSWKFLQLTPNIKKTREHILFPTIEEYRPSHLLECPYCRSENTHHIGVEIFDKAEDSQQGDHFTFWCRESYAWNILGDAEGMQVSIPNDMFDNDCSNGQGFRRGSIQIHCVCEECTQMFSMVIAQIKGTTQAGVEKTLGVNK